MNLGEVLHGNEDLGVGGSAVCGECNLGNSEGFDQGAITGSGRRYFFDGLDCFVLVGMVGQLICVVA